MALYTPAAFRSPGKGVVEALLRAYPFATLVTQASSETFISHLPLLWEPESTDGALIGHLASANPHTAVLTAAPSVAIFLGPHCYVSPSWYGEPAMQVPTWNYAAVHAHGVMTFLEGDSKLQCIDQLAKHFETGRARPWTRQLAGNELQHKLSSIIAFRMPIARIDAKFKMSQNRAPRDHHGVIDGLRAHGGHDESAVADWMLTHVSH